MWIGNCGCLIYGIYGSGNLFLIWSPNKLAHKHTTIKMLFFLLRQQKERKYAETLRKKKHNYIKNDCDCNLYLFGRRDGFVEKKLNSYFFRTQRIVLKFKILVLTKFLFQ